MQKNSQTRVTFSGFLRIFKKLCGSKVHVAPPHGNFRNDISPLTVKSFIKFQKIFQPPPLPPSSAPTIVTPPTFRDPRIPKYFE